ncbi:zinc finger MYM-type protein 1-like isoform X4 [Gordionus sp. m RMFG-2023]|uniref:zinc finger MYM-type protein 1-like isoform X4 n=1 Tax=Gordionus sp. m RMFG-2023 TaxID=3053472 RepID=UPI0031FC593D
MDINFLNQMPSNKINYKVKCLHTGCNSNKIRKDKINLHYKTRHPNSDVKFEVIAIKKDKVWNKLGPNANNLKITNGINTQFKKNKSIATYFQKEIDSPLDTLKINLPQPLHNIITLNQDEEKTYNMETAFIFKDKVQSHLDAPYPEIIPFIDDETSKIENMPRSSNLDNPEKISGNLSTIKEGKNDDIDMQALESIYIDKALHLPLEYLIGQSMDGASNMRGVNKGVQALIFKEAPKAIYVWCHAHRLNLIVIRICGYGNEIKKTMGILDELYNFMNGVKRQGVFTKFQMQKTKKSHKRIKNTTRNWASSFKALQNFLDVYEYIIASLTELSNSDDAITFSISEGLLSRIKRYDFILGLFILRIILKCTHETCIEMQAIGNDLAMMIKLIQHTKNKFQRLRANGDNILTSLHTDVKSFMDKNNVTTDIYNIKSIFKLDQKEFDNYIEQQKEKYKNENFYPVINMIIEQLNERFNYESLNFLNQISIFTPAGLADNENIEISQISEIVCLYNFDPQKIIDEFSNFRPLYLDSLSIIYSKDLINIRKNDTLYDESENIINDSKMTKTKRWLKYSFILPYRLLIKSSSFPYLKTLYKYLITLPTTSCSAERAMSKVKIVKTRIRNKISDSFLENLLLISSEIDIYDTFKTEDIITDFALTSKRLSNLLIG